MAGKAGSALEGACPQLAAHGDSRSRHVGWVDFGRSSWDQHEVQRDRLLSACFAARGNAMPAMTIKPRRETYSATCGQFSEHLHSHLQPPLCPVPQAACTAPGLTRGRGHCCVSPVTQRGAQSSSDQSWLASLPPPSGSLHPSVPIFLLGHLLDQGCCTKPG